MSTGAGDILELIGELGFVVADQNKALGQPAGIPTTLTVLNAAPLALMFRFRVHPDGSEIQPLVDLLKSVPDDRASISLEDGFVFLTLYDLSGLTNSSLRLLMERIAEALAATDLAVGPGCLRCGGFENAQLMLVEGRPTRLCLECLSEAAREKQEVESQLNRGSVTATLGLPAVCGFVAAGWIILWTVIDLILETLHIKVIEINELTGLVFMGLLGGVGYALGRPMGNALRQSIAIRRAPVVMSLVVIVAAGICGEIGYIALRLLRLFGFFDLGVAARLLWQYVSSYSIFWIVCKLVFLGAICLFCAMTASERRQVSLNV